MVFFSLITNYYQCYIDYPSIILENNDTKEKIYVKYSIWKSLSPSNIHEIIEDLYNLEQLLSKKDKLIISRNSIQSLILVDYTLHKTN